MRRSRRQIGCSLLLLLALAPAASATSTASVSGTALTVTGSAAADQILVTLPGGDGVTPDPATGAPEPPPDPATTPYQVTDATAVTAGAGCTQVSVTQADCSRGGAAFGSFTVRVDGGEGNDYIQTFMPAQALGDLVFLNGGGGDDAIFGSENDEVVSGDAGNDLMDGGAGADIMSGGTLTDHVPSFEGAVTQPASYTPGPGAGCDRVYGGAFDDQITDGDVDSGTAAPQPTVCTDVLNSDIVDGAVCSGEPLPAGVPAPAAVTACPTLEGNVDNLEDHDAIMLAHRARPLSIDVLVLTATQGAAGENESIRHFEAVWGGSGDDSFWGRDGDFGDDSLRGNGGNDRLEARGGDDELLGGDGQDHLIGGPGADVLNPGSRIVSRTATATAATSDGADIVDGGANSTIVGGHAQSDLVTYEGRSEPVRIDMTQPSTLGAPGENDVIVGVEDVMGGHAGDEIVGDASHNLISGDPQQTVAGGVTDPPPPPGPSGGSFGNDHITTRDGGPDTVDCTGGTGDVHIADERDASVNCESLVRPAPDPKPAANAQNGTEAGCQAAYKCEGGIELAGPNPAGRVTVARNGSFRLTKNTITCPRTGGTCMVRAFVTTPMPGRPGGRSSKKTRRIGIGGGTYTVRAKASRSVVQGRLTMRGLGLLKRRKSLTATVEVTVVWEAVTKKRRISVSLRAPQSARRS